MITGVAQRAKLKVYIPQTSREKMVVENARLTQDWISFNVNNRVLLTLFYVILEELSS